MTSSTPNPYLRESVLTATPEQLQLMLYDGCIRFARQARDALAARDYEKSHDRLCRAQAIIVEMEAGLRREVNPELCGRLASIYGFLYRKLVEAGIRKDLAALDDALKVLEIERGTWELLVERANVARADQASPGRSPAPAEAAFISPGTICLDA